MRKNYKKAFKLGEIIIVVIIAVISIITLKQIILKINYPQKYSKYVEKYSQEYKIDKELIYAMIKAESNFKADAISNKNALGLMQILESTAEEVAKSIKKEITKEEILNPEINICLGTKYIASLFEKYGNLELAIVAYNAGIGNVDGWIEKGILKQDGSNIENVPYKETNNYTRKVLRDYKIYQKLCD